MRLAGLVRLTHPFPSLLDGAATVAIALLAGGDAVTALRLGASMVALQASIGASTTSSTRRPTPVANPANRSPPVSCAGRRPPGGRHWRGASGLSLAAGRASACLSSPSAVLAVGYAYDLRAKGTAWSWLPFALGIPLLPVFAWFGAAGRLPGAFAILLPAAVAVGTALAIANARADIERDLAAGHASVATRLGPAAPGRWAAVARAVVLVALASLVAAGAAAGRRLGGARGRGGGHDRRRLGAWPAASAARRERAWEIQAIGVAAARCRVAGGRRRPGVGELGPCRPSVVRVVAPDDRDRVLELELGDRQVLGQVLSVGLRDGAAQLRAAQHRDQVFDRVGEVLLGVDKRVIGDRDGADSSTQPDASSARGRTLGPPRSGTPRPPRHRRRCRGRDRGPRSCRGA